MSLTEEQRAAVERRDGSLLVRAGAGTGKTTVLVERFVRALVDDGVAVEALLAITFTDKAAAEMKARVRQRLIELGRREDARAAESASISTIHAFCGRMLRTHALSAGIDPEYRLLDELEADRLAIDAFDRALEEFLGPAAESAEGGGEPDRLELIASYTPDGLREMVRAAHSFLRSRGERAPSLAPSTAPRPAGERERLELAARSALAELSGTGGKQVEEATTALAGCLALLERLGPGGTAEPQQLADLKLLGGSARALQSDACREYGDALTAFKTLSVARRAHLDRELLRALLDLYGRRYERAKRDRGGLDFEDLQLIARDLLRGDDGLREQYASRHAHVLVDECQDVNPLQSELIELVAGDNVFRVGDENQSIYGFRHADVSVFSGQREAAAKAGRVASISVNFRARQEILDAIDLAFEPIFGEGFEPLRAAPGACDTEPGAPAVELLVVDRSPKRWGETDIAERLGAAIGAVPVWRALEARLLARRIDALCADGPWSYGDVALLLRATTSMSVYERALEERGIPTHVVGGRGYWSQQQVSDLRHWLAALANPLDELALYSVFASPLVGLSLDSLALIALRARREARDPLWTIRAAIAGTGDSPAEGELASVLPEAELRKLARFLERFEGERRMTARVALETVIDRAVTATGYDRRLLSLPAGERRMANVRKLMRMAREYEAEEGRDLRGFIDSLADRDLLQAREGEAPLEGEQRDAVRLMTIHRAKGLEFPVVAMADLGKDGREDHGRLRLSADGDVGLRLASLGGGTVDTHELERIKAEQKRAAEGEERRIAYVAATRAQHQLILSGATDLERRPSPRDLGEPMAWVWRGFCAGLPDDGARGTHVERYEGRQVRVAWQRLAPATLDELLSAADLAPAMPAPAAAEGELQGALELAAPPAPRALPVSRLSYSGLEAYRRCPYRFYLERALRLPPVERAVAESPPESALPGTSGLSPLLRGSLVHTLLEQLDFQRPSVPAAAEVAALIGRHTLAREEDVEDLRSMVVRFVASDLCARIGRAQAVRAEHPFAFTLVPAGAGGRSLLVNGVVDVHATEADGVLVVDYKSDPLQGRPPEELCAGDYATQRLVYALAALRAGAAHVTVSHCFLERPDTPAVAQYAADQADALEQELVELARGVVEARFEPTPTPHRELCGDCPGRAALCSWPPERTLAPPPEASAAP